MTGLLIVMTLLSSVLSLPLMVLERVPEPVEELDKAVRVLKRARKGTVKRAKKAGEASARCLKKSLSASVFEASASSARSTASDDIPPLAGDDVQVHTALQGSASREQGDASNCTTPRLAKLELGGSSKAGLSRADSFAGVKLPDSPR